MRIWEKTKNIKKDSMILIICGEKITCFSIIKHKISVLKPTKDSL